MVCDSQSVSKIRPEMGWNKYGEWEGSMTEWHLFLCQGSLMWPRSFPFSFLGSVPCLPCISGCWLFLLIYHLLTLHSERMNKSVTNFKTQQLFAWSGTDILLPEFRDWVPEKNSKNIYYQSTKELFLLLYQVNTRETVNVAYSVTYIGGSFP